MDPPARRQKRSYYCRHCNALVSNTGGMVPDHGCGAARYSVARPRRASRTSHVHVLVACLRTFLVECRYGVRTCRLQQTVIARRHLYRRHLHPSTSRQICHDPHPDERKLSLWGRITCNLGHEDTSSLGHPFWWGVFAEPHVFKMHVYTAFIRVSSLDVWGGGDLYREPHAVKMSHLSAAFTCQDVPSLGGGFHCRRGGGGGGLCREPHEVKMSHLSAAFTCQDVPSLGGGFHCRRGGGGGGGGLV